MPTKLRTLPDHLRPGLDVVFVGSNPSCESVRRGHYYAKSTNQFWRLLHEAGFATTKFQPEGDGNLLDLGVGLTDVAKRPTNKMEELSDQEWSAGAAALRRKLRRYRPRVVCFNGRDPYRRFTGRRCDFGRQTEPVEGAIAYVVPSTSARSPAYSLKDKLEYFQELKGLVHVGAKTKASPTLPDYLRPGLEVVFVGINPGRWSAERGHHYAGPGNHFWPLLQKAGFVDRPVTYEDDASMPGYGIGLTNVVERMTPAASDLSRDELRAGADAVRRKLRRYRPRVVAFNGKLIYEAFAGRACDFGLQQERAEGALVYVMPSTSPRGASYQLADKLRFFRELKRIVDKERRADAARR